MCRSTGSVVAASGRRTPRRTLAGAVALALVALLAACAPSLDETFGGGDGIATSRVYAGASHTPLGIVRQPDGKIVVAYQTLAVGNAITLARFDVNGEPDLGFGTSGDGKTVTEQTGWPGCADIAMQPDGKFVVAGYVWTPMHETFGVARYNPDGTLDTQFGGEGYVFPDGDSNNAACGLAVQPDGKILLGGSLRGDGFDLLRYMPGGWLDRDFGANGISHVELMSRAGIRRLALLPNGEILAAGVTTSAQGTQRITLARFSDDGSLDFGFGATGVAVVPLQAEFDGPVALRVRPNGRILVAHTTEQFSSTGLSQFAVTQFFPDGEIDSAFGQGGTTTAGDAVDAKDMILLDDGRIIVAGGDMGYADPELRTGRYALARFQPDGTIDGGFADHGIDRSDRIDGDEFLYVLLMQPDGRLVAAGRVLVRDEEGSGAPDVVVYRFAAT